MTDIVALSGWAMPNSVFDSLSNYCALKAFSLPGVDCWPKVPDDCLLTSDKLVHSLDGMIGPEPFTLVGWSLGGVIAACYALAFPDKVKHLILMGCNPCFVANSSWSFGMDEALYHQFVLGMKSDIESTLKKFMFLCVSGAKKSRSLLKHLDLLKQEVSLSFPLLYRMLLLLQKDIRKVLHSISCPVTFVFAQNDALVPVDVVPDVCHQFADSRIVSVEGSHLFFMEEPEKTASIIMESRISP